VARVALAALLTAGLVLVPSLGAVGSADAQAGTLQIATGPLDNFVTDDSV
jgi:hypothetical protein